MADSIFQPTTPPGVVFLPLQDLDPMPSAITNAFNAVKTSFVDLIAYNKIATLIVFGVGALVGHIL